MNSIMKVGLIFLLIFILFVTRAPSIPPLRERIHAEVQLIANEERARCAEEIANLPPPIAEDYIEQKVAAQSATIHNIAQTIKTSVTIVMMTAWGIAVSGIFVLAYRLMSADETRIRQARQDAQDRFFIAQEQCDQAKAAYHEALMQRLLPPKPGDAKEK